MTELIEIGVISDTHGHLTAAACEALAGVALILHAGDLDTPEVLARLAKIAPVQAVRGNMDRHPDLRALPPSRVVEIGGLALYMLHDFLDLDLNPVAAGFQAVISGHTHRPELTWRGPTLYLNPGSASAPRGVPQPSLARLTVAGGALQAALVQLPPE